MPKYNCGQKKNPSRGCRQEGQASQRLWLLKQRPFIPQYTTRFRIVDAFYPFRLLVLFCKPLIQDSVNDYNIMPANSRRSLCLAKLYDLQNLLTASILQLGPQEDYHEDFRIIVIQKVIVTRVLYQNTIKMSSYQFRGFYYVILTTVMTYIIIIKAYIRPYKQYDSPPKSHRTP